jgi:hypothetical protein
VVFGVWVSVVSGGVRGMLLDTMVVVEVAAVVICNYAGSNNRYKILK